MRRHKNKVLLALGIVLLVAGVWTQDFCVSKNIIESGNIIGTPSWSYFFYPFLWATHQYIGLGLILKTIGFGLLFSLLFVKLHTISKRERARVTIPTLLGLSSALCFALFTISPPVARTASWGARIIATQLPPGLDSQSLREIRNVYFAEAHTAISGAIVFAIGAFLLAAAVVFYRRKRIPLISIPAAVLFLLAQEKREAVSVTISWFDTILSEGVFSAIAALLYPVVAFAIFVWALRARNKEPRRLSQLTVILLVITGCLALLFWATLAAKFNALRSESSPIAVTRSFYNHISNVRQITWSPIISGFSLSIVLMTSAIFLPILCAFSLRRRPRRTEDEQEGRKTSIPLIALIVTICAFAFVCLFGLLENRYKASLTKIALAEDEDWKTWRERAKDDVARVESEEGLRFLRKMLNDPREFFWHRFILHYLWENSQSLKGDGSGVTF